MKTTNLLMWVLLLIAGVYLAATTVRAALTTNGLWVVVVLMLGCAYAALREVIKVWRDE